MAIAAQWAVQEHLHVLLPAVQAVTIQVLHATAHTVALHALQAQVLILQAPAHALQAATVLRAAVTQAADLVAEVVSQAVEAASQAVAHVVAVVADNQIDHHTLGLSSIF